MRAFTRALLLTILGLCGIVALGAAVLTVAAVTKLPQQWPLTGEQWLALLIPPAVGVMVVILAARVLSAYRKWDRQLREYDQ